MKLKSFLSIGALGIALCCGMCAVAPAEETSQGAAVVDPLQEAFTTQVVYSDGKHNAFTGATSWKGRVFISFRNAEHHVSFDGKIKLVATSDGKEFKEMATIAQPGKDLRDPKVVNCGKQLHIYAGAVDQSDTNRYHTEAKLYTSKDGAQWTERKLTGLYPDSWLWFVHYDGKHYYGGAYSRPTASDPAQATLYKSRNGIDWKPFFSVPEVASNEVGLDTGADGALYALVRQEKAPYHPILLTIPNVEEPGLFKWRPLPFPMQGPFIKRMKEGSIVIGRRWEDPKQKSIFANPSDKRRVEMIWLGDDGKIERLCTLDSAGDCSYPGWAELPDGRVLVSYYSGHEGTYPKANIYAAIFDSQDLPAGSGCIPRKNKR